MPLAPKSGGPERRLAMQWDLKGRRRGRLMANTLRSVRIAEYELRMSSGPIMMVLGLGGMPAMGRRTAIVAATPAERASAQ